LTVGLIAACLFTALRTHKVLFTAVRDITAPPFRRDRYGAADT